MLLCSVYYVICIVLHAPMFQVLYLVESKIANDPVNAWLISKIINDVWALIRQAEILAAAGMYACDGV